MTSWPVSQRRVSKARSAAGSRPLTITGGELGAGLRGDVAEPAARELEERLGHGAADLSL